MCLARRRLDPKARRFLAVGNLCLCSGLMLGLFGKNAFAHHQDIFDGLRGLLLGLAIAINFWALRLSRRCVDV